jgi:hypothetical protein
VRLNELPKIVRRRQLCDVVVLSTETLQAVRFRLLSVADFVSRSFGAFGGKDFAQDLPP